MLRSSLLTVLAALLLVPADALVTSLTSAAAPGLLSTAQAADFTGRIRNVRIKKKRVGSGFRVVTQTAGEFAGVASVQTIVRVSGASDDVLDELTAQSHANTRVVGFGPDESGLSDGDTVTILLSNDPDDDFDWDDADDGYTTEERSRLELVYDGDLGEARGEAGQRVRVRVNNRGALRVVLTNDDGSWDPQSVASIGYLLEGQAGIGVTIDEVRQRWVTDVQADLTDYDVVSVETTLLDAQGGIVDTLLETSSLTGLPAPGLDSIAVRENRRGEAKLVTWTTSEGGPASLSVELTDAETGETTVSAVDSTPAFTERTYTYEGLEFDPGESPTDYVYLCLIDMISAEGDPVGEQYEVELTVPVLAEGEEFAVDVASFADGTGSVSFLNTGDGLHVVGALWNDEAAQAESFNLIFEEPFEGPAPLETEVNVQLVSQFDKWVQTGAVAQVGAYSLTASLTTSDGEVLDTMRASGSGTGSVKEGEIVAGTVVTIGDKEVILNIGFKSEGSGS